MVGADGGVFTFGDAKFEGSCPGIGGCPGGAAVAVVPDGTGNGYWVVTAGGYVTAFGDAPSPGEPAVRESLQPYGPTTGAATTCSTQMARSTGLATPSTMAVPSVTSAGSTQPRPSSLRQTAGATGLSRPTGRSSPRVTPPTRAALTRFT